MIEHFAEKFTSNKIEFVFKVNGSIPYMPEHVISQSRLETMIGAHLQDALIAVNASENTFRSVFIGIGLAGDCYEFAVSDSGVPFEVDTLVQLGTERVTTHADTGGSGIGFMITFETMRKYGASLIISEKQPSAADYTKSVTIRFEGNNRYTIETYRLNEFPPSDRFMVVDREK